MLSNFSSKVNNWIGDNKSDLLIAACFFLIALISFGLGRLSVIYPKKEPIRIEYPRNSALPSKPSRTENENSGSKFAGQAAGVYVGSKNSDKYHLPDCPGALRIKEENKIWFSSKEEAESLGYVPAANCEGI